MIKNKKLLIAFIVMTSILLEFPSAVLIQAKETQDDNADPVIVVSLGDSYSSGEGIEPFYGQEDDRTKSDDWLAHRSTKSWPSLLKVQGLDKSLSNYKDKNWFFVASSGAVTDNLLHSQKKKYWRGFKNGKRSLDPQLDVFDDFDENTVDYVTMTFGGNDVGFVNIITTAVEDTIFSIKHINPRKLSDNIKLIWNDFYDKGGIQENIKEAYMLVSKRAGTNASIIVAGYPHLLVKSGSGFLFDPDQAREINDNVTKFNNQLAILATSCKEDGANIYFVPVEKAFDGHEAYAEDPYINEIIFFAQKQDLTIKPPSAYSIHPNENGAKAYAACVQAKIDELEAAADTEADTEMDPAPVPETETATESPTEIPNLVKDMIDAEVERQTQRALEWLSQNLQKMVEEWLNQWLAESCENC